MKPYKLKRRQEEHGKRHPTKFNRKQELIRCTKQVALEQFKKVFDGYWHWGGNSAKDIFGWQLADKLELQLTYSDLEIMYPLYLRCIKALEDKKKKAVFIEKTYKPLAEDLFEIS